MTTKKTVQSAVSKILGNNNHTIVGQFSAEGIAVAASASDIEYVSMAAALLERALEDNGDNLRLITAHNLIVDAMAASGCRRPSDAYQQTLETEGGDRNATA